MKITQSHYTFWMEKRTPTPTWAATVAPKVGKVSIHYLINAQVDDGRRRSVEPGNTIAILRSARKHMPDIRAYLRHLAADPSGSDPIRRVAFARRVLRRLGPKTN